jgi:hypothetical protein
MANVTCHSCRIYGVTVDVDEVSEHIRHGRNHERTWFGQPKKVPPVDNVHSLDRLRRPRPKSD